MRRLLGVPNLNMPERRGGAAQPGDAQGSVFEEPWQAHAFAIVMSLYQNGHYTWPDWDDYLGHEIQSPDHFPGAPKQEQEIKDRANYNQFLAACEEDGARYYHHWLAGLEKMLDKKGLVSASELSEREAAIRKVEETGPRFQPGASVKVLDVELLGHSHLPSYIRGVEGQVEADRGAHVFPSSHGHGRTDALQHVYTVRLLATDIWGADADSRHSLNFSLWDYQLEPAY